MAASEYPRISRPRPMLRRLFDKSKFAISTEETRYYLNGVYMHVAEGEDGKALRCRGDRRPPAGPDRRALPDGARTCPA
jgi:DNA polymerase-3 subunit beta